MTAKEQASSSRLVSVEEILAHQSLEDLWLVVDGVVYDLSDFAPTHPGGVDILLQYAGRDATAAYSEVHSLSLISTSLPTSSRIGVLDTSTVTSEWTQPPAVMEKKKSVVLKDKCAKPTLERMFNAHDFWLAAQKSYTPKAWAFLSSAATDCLTMEWNGSAYNNIVLRPRVLRDVSTVDLGTTMLGHRITTPIFIAPTSMGKLFHPQGERELARGAQRVGIPQCVSTSCSFPLSEVMDALEEKKSKDGTNVPIFFQLYVDKQREKSEKLLALAAERGVKAVFLTIDAPVIGKREADERLRADEDFKLPMSGMKAKNDSKGGSLGRLMGSYIDASVTWDDLAWLRKTVPGLPIVLKGIQTAMDAVKAMEHGVEAIYLTNHGGRSLDTAPATILVLLELQKCCPQIFDKMEVYIDGGITRGTDIFKALCLGAKAVGIGRGFLFALNYGEEGIERFVNILADELQTTMQLCGVTCLDQVHPGLLHTGAVDYLVPGSEEHPYAKWRPKSRL
ncbi:mitochondrial cytochrome-like protein b2 [Xylaria sp. CBS 124048]|nr:mitochondrial cytochrome-like protein b2 [Xylaria sp. CBS 124048]